MTLRRVDPHARRSRIYRAFARLLGTRAAGWVSRSLVWKLDPYVMRLTRGRVGFGMLLPTAVFDPDRLAFLEFVDGLAHRLRLAT